MDDLRDFLRKRFDPNTWTNRVFSAYQYGGANLVEEVNALNPSFVVDIGCGHNYFKGKIQNLFGFDQSPFPNVDKVSFIEDIDFAPESVDVALCLGSIQFGGLEVMIGQLKKIVSWVKPGGFIIMRSDVPSGQWPLSTIELVSSQLNLSIAKGVFTETIYNYEGVLVATKQVWWWQKNE